MIIAIVVAVIALGLAIFGFVDRKAIEADLKDLHARVDALESSVDAKLRNAVHAVRADVLGRVQSLESRAGTIEKKVVAEVKGAAHKVKSGFNAAKKRL
jgi:phage shock protein A